MFAQYGSNGGSARVYLYKHAAGVPDTQAPTAPSNLQLSVISNTQIDLSWTASSDNVGIAGYNIERCQDDKCSPTVEVQATSGTGTTWSDTGLSTGTTYGYRIRARDAVPNYSGYQTTPATVIYATTQATAPDTTNPTVTITGPTSNPTYDNSGSSTVTLSGNASDNVGVTGVTWACAVCTPTSGTATGTTSWSQSSITLASGANTITVSSHDAAGNTGADSITVTYTPGGSNFATRCAAAGVVRCWSFATSADLGVQNIGIDFGYFNNSGPGTCFSNASTWCPEFDNSVPNGPAMVFRIPSQSGSGGSGQWFGNFSSNYLTQFGSNTVFYYQWRQRFSSCYLYIGTDDANCLSNQPLGVRIYCVTPPAAPPCSGLGGWKLVSAASGDSPGCTPGNSHSTNVNCTDSCTVLELLVQNTNQRGFPQMYQSCNGSTHVAAYQPSSLSRVRQAIYYSRTPGRHPTVLMGKDSRIQKHFSLLPVIALGFSLTNG